MWDHSVKPKDAVHVATALHQDVPIEQLDTFDEPLMNLSGKLGSPPLKIGLPNLPPKLPFYEDGDESEEDESDPTD